MSVPKILVADDERIARDNLEYVLRKEGYDVVAVENGGAAVQGLETQGFDLVMTDLHMQPVNGMQVLYRAKELQPEIEVIIITGYASVDSAVEAMRKGAYHYISKPYKIDEIRILVRQALEKIALRREVAELRQQVKSGKNVVSLVGNSPQMEALKKSIEQVAGTDCNVLILGETGTGKELVARRIHQLSPRADKRFMAVNCGAFSQELLANELFGHDKEAFTGARGIRKGLIEAAQGGTILLDEIGDMPFLMQVKLLRVLQERTLMRVGGTEEIAVDIRIVAATNKDLKREVEHGAFRQDLFYRLNVVTLMVPRLADRKEDILFLSLHFLRKASEAYSKRVEAVSDEAMEVLLSYEFPGNVRELENVMERAVTLASGKTVELEHLPMDLQQLAGRIKRPGSELLTLEENEREYIGWVLDRVEGNKTKAAEILGIDRVSLWRKLKRYHME